MASLAARFAAKEALAKALGAPHGMAWHDAEVRLRGLRPPAARASAAPCRRAPTSSASTTSTSRSPTTPASPRRWWCSSPEPAPTWHGGQRAFRLGLRLGLPYAAVGFVLSLSFGVLAVQAGFTAPAGHRHARRWCSPARRSSPRWRSSPGRRDRRGAVRGHPDALALPGHGHRARAVAARRAAAAGGRGSGGRRLLVGAGQPGRRDVQPVADDRDHDPAVRLVVRGHRGRRARRRPDRRPREATVSTCCSRPSSSPSCWRSCAARRLASRRSPDAGIALALVPFTPAGIPVLAAGAAALIGLGAARRRTRRSLVSLSEQEVWLLIGALVLMTAAIKAVGPALVGGRELPAVERGSRSRCWPPRC